MNRSSGLKAAKSDPKVLEQLMERAKQNATQPISIRIPISDVERAKKIAQKVGVGYQTVLKKAIREGLKRAG
jgi:predicted DNA binding CopG/RHH family protein